MKNQQQFQWDDWTPDSSDNTPENNKQSNIQWQEYIEENNNQDTNNDLKFINHDQKNNNQDTNNDLKFFGTENDNSQDNNTNFSVIGKTDELFWHGYLYNLNCNNTNIKNEIKNLDSTPKKNDGRYEFNPQENSELGKFVKSLLECSLQEFDLRILDCNIIKCAPNESFLNIFSGKPSHNFIYVAQSNDNVGDIVIDFSSMGGPSYGIKKYEEGTLLLIPGWIPYKIAKNNSQQDHILIAGALGK